MQAEIMSIENAEKIADYPKQVERGNYWKTEYDKVVIMYKEREKNKKLILDNFRKIFSHLLFEKENYTRMDISILHNQLEKYLFSIFEVCENTCKTEREK